MSFRYDKENLFKEFEIAKNKDLKVSKNTYTNRIQSLKEHRDLKKKINLYLDLIQNRPLRKGLVS